MNSDKIRQAWRQCMESHDHVVIPSASLIPDSSDKTVLFTTAWMHPLVPYLMWKPHPAGKRLADIQKCLRTGDIEDVWDERHLTFFEMMWNWSLWDYFKPQALEISYELLTQYFWVDPRNLGVTVFEWNEKIWVDEAAIEIWKNLGVPENKIKKLGADDNFWWPAWKTWPCGPCSEMYFDRWEKYGPEDWDLWTNDRYTEVWNDVFMEFYKDENWNFSPLSQKNVDNWRGLERIAMLLQNTETVYETDIFETILKWFEKISWINYPPYHTKAEDRNEKQIFETKCFRVVADHIRATSFMISDWVLPTNEWRWYILRRLIRRMWFFASRLWNFESQKFCEVMVDALNEKMWVHYPQLINDREKIISTLKKEIDAFDANLQKWVKFIQPLVEKTGWKLDGPTAFMLYDTYGLPLDLLKEYFSQVDEEGYEKSLEEAKNKSRNSAKDFFQKWIDWPAYLSGIPQTEFVGYENLESESNVLKDFEVDWQRFLIFDKTPFYPTGWGQLWDSWVVELNWENLKIIDTIKYSWVIIHLVE